MSGQFQPWYVDYEINRKQEDFKKSILGKQLIKQKADKEKKEKERLKKQKQIRKRLNKPLFKEGGRTGTRGGGVRVSAQAGIRGFFK